MLHILYEVYKTNEYYLRKTKAFAQNNYQNRRQILLQVVGTSTITQKIHYSKSFNRANAIFWHPLVKNVKKKKKRVNKTAIVPIVMIQLLV